MQVAMRHAAHCTIFLSQSATLLQAYRLLTLNLWQVAHRNSIPQYNSYLPVFA
jgi:hypothetical protein